MQLNNVEYSKVIITGGTGWLGKRVVSMLRAFNPTIEIRCLVLKNENTTHLTSLECQVIEGDVQDKTSLKNLFQDAHGALVLHCAGLIHPRLRTHEFYDVNVQGSQNILLSSQEAFVKRLVAMSSNSPLGVNPHPDHLFDENSPYHPYMGYGKSKWQMEQLLIQGMEQAPEITIIRAPWFYGPDQPARQTVFFKMIKEGKFPLVGDGKNKRSMAYIDNLAEGILLAGHHPKAANEIFWIADERPYTMLEIITTIQYLLKNDFGLSVNERIPHLPGVVGDIAQACDWLIQSLGFYQQKIHVLSEMNKTIACDISKAQKILNYHPKISLQEGMKRSIEFCLKSGISI